MAEIQTNTDHCDPSHDDLSSLGRVLREERERLGMSSKDLADSLHMGREQLEALENGDRRNLPESVFICGMLRRVSEKLGLDPVPIVQQFQSQLSAQKEPPSKRLISESSVSTRSSKEQNDKKGVNRLIKNAAIPFLLVAITALSAIVFYRNRQPAVMVEREALSGEPAIKSAPGFDDGSATDSDVEGGKRALGQISIESKQPSWVSIRNGSGDVIYEGTLSEQKNFDGDQDLEIFAGRPDLVLFSRGNDTPRALGGIDQLRWYSITPEL
ncbi:MAG: helix-turn-helix domain-containing protein [Propionibacteriaceae bacterium]|jgi:transcriptional regulator with XRE-family HTH domain|nr:helix-turn-helix domain-containing protein [Propionibacteriaceae bacterium]MBT65818.1 helix-turn-helix domain-containing protein [Synechococcus sp. NP17]|tara:strand:+ start:16098 stop:16907 length:810 start_codon:yes stop_codon:yes gene_type:complete